MTRIVSIFLLIVCSVIVLFWVQYEKAWNEVIEIESPVIFEINKGDSFNRISRKLIEQKVNINPFWFKIIAYKNKVSHKLKAGEYELKNGLTMPEILTLFVKGKSRQYSITFPEGWSFKQILEELHHNTHLVKTLSSTGEGSIMARLGAEYNHPEGLFFPDTYFFEKGTSDFSILKKAYNKMQLILKQEWENREKNIPITSPYQALILASIVEKETGVAEERSRIAGVFSRRLKKGMLLQTDPTVIYGMGDKYKGNIRYRDLKRATPYNTYIIKGLPPTPIAMPGKAAIHAVLHPGKDKSLYFVAKGNGSHIFSATLREHNKAVNKYQRKK